MQEQNEKLLSKQLNEDEIENLKYATNLNNNVSCIILFNERIKKMIIDIFKDQLLTINY